MFLTPESVAELFEFKCFPGFTCCGEFSEALRVQQTYSGAPANAHSDPLHKSDMQSPGRKAFSQLIWWKSRAEGM